MIFNKKLQLNGINKCQSSHIYVVDQLFRNFSHKFGTDSTSSSSIRLIQSAIKLFNQQIRKKFTSTSSPFLNHIRCTTSSYFRQAATRSRVAFFNSATLFYSYIRRQSQKFIRSGRTGLANNNGRSSLFMLAATGLFNWEECQVGNDEIRKEVNEILGLFEAENKHALENKRIDFEQSRNIETDEWKIIYNQKDLIIWRRNISVNELASFEPGATSTKEKVVYDLYEYKVLGRMHDVTPLEFFQTQLDLNYRSKWDHLVLGVELLHTDPSTQTELLRWLMRFPYPLNPREYVFVRRYCLEVKQNMLIMVSRCIPETVLDRDALSRVFNLERKKSDDKYVRVNSYKSNIVVMPEKEDLNKPGVVYIMQYYDINKARIPSVAYRWMATSGLPDYLDRVHRNTLKLKQHNISSTSSNIISPHFHPDNLLKHISTVNLNQDDVKNDQIKDQKEDQTRQEPPRIF